MVGKSFNHYRVLERVGAGGMGVVYRARDERLERDVAIKILPPETAADPAARSRLLEEARLASSLNHPNICTIYEVGEAEGQGFIAMEYVQGETLSARIPAEGLPAETVLRYGDQIAAGLEHAHAHGVIHRDLKSSNVRVNAEGRAKILDFGLAERLPQAEAATAEQPDATPGRHTAISGTLSYMAPETLRGEAPDARSDLWALGVILHEMASGTQPFRGGTGFAVSSAILRDPPAALPEKVPQGLRDVVRRCLAKEPAARYQNAGELRAALEAVQSGHTGEQAVAAQAATGGVRRTAIALAVLLLLVAGAYLAWKPPGPRGATHHVAIVPVLPPEADGETASLGTGLAETLNARLAHAASKLGILLVPSSEVRARRVASLQDARDQFGVDLCVEFSVHRAGKLARVTYSLVDTGSFRQIEAGTLTAGGDDPLVLEDQFADRVVGLVGDFVRSEPGSRVAATTAEATTPSGAPASSERSAASPVAAANSDRSQAAPARSQPQDLYRAGMALLSDRYNPDATERAIGFFHQAAETDSRFGLAYAGLGQALWMRYEQTKDRKWVGQAQVACHQAVSVQPHGAAGFECLGVLAAGTGDYEAAVTDYQKALALEPQNTSVQVRLGEVYEKQGKLQDAERALLNAVERDPQNETGFNRLGALYLRQGRFGDSARMFSEVIALSPTGVSGYSNLGSVYFSEGRYADAIPQFELSLAIKPTAVAMSNLGTAYFHLKRYADAARVFEKAVKLDDKNYEAWGNLGDALYWAPRRRAEAPAAYRRAIALGDENLKVNPRDANLLGYLALYHAMLGERDLAREALASALELAPRDSDVLMSAAQVHMQLGDIEGTLSFLGSALAAGASASALRDLPNFDSLREDSRYQQLSRKYTPAK